MSKHTSHPMRVRGLKPMIKNIEVTKLGSHPTRVLGSRKEKS